MRMHTLTHACVCADSRCANVLRLCNVKARHACANGAKAMTCQGPRGGVMGCPTTRQSKSGCFGQGGVPEDTHLSQAAPNAASGELRGRDTARLQRAPISVPKSLHRAAPPLGRGLNPCETTQGAPATCSSWGPPGFRRQSQRCTCRYYRSAGQSAGHSSFATPGKS